MRVSATAWLVFAVLSASVCSPGVARSDASGDIPGDAVAAANTQILNAGFKQCGEYWGGEHPRDMLMVATEYQIKNLRIEIQKIGGKVSAADALNGVEWQGLATLKADASRSRAKGAKDWSAWGTGLPYGVEGAMTLSKVNGQWHVLGGDMLGSVPSCST